MATATMGSPMTRNEALAWCVDRLEGWPPVPATNALNHAPSGWEWTRHVPGVDGWTLAKSGDAVITEAHYNDARNIRDLNSIGKARTMSFQACGVSADIGQRVKVKDTRGNVFTATLAGVHGNNAWFVDPTGAPFSDDTITRTRDEITGFARVTDRDEFIDRAVEVMFKGNPAMSKHVARSSAVSMWNAGARFTDQGDE